MTYPLLKYLPTFISVLKFTIVLNSLFVVVVHFITLEPAPPAFRGGWVGQVISICLPTRDL